MELPGLAEPVGLRARVAREPDAVRAEIASGRLIVTPLWKAWGPALAAQGLDRAALSAILRGYGYELWLWAVGERTWAQSLEGLAGRVSRRVGARTPVKAARAATPTGRPSKATKARVATRASAAAKAKKAGKATKARPATRTPKARKVAKPGRATKAKKTTKVTKATTARRVATPTKAAKATGSGRASKTAKSTKSAKSAKTAKSTRAAGPARKTRRR